MADGLNLFGLVLQQLLINYTSYNAGISVKIGNKQK